MKSKSMEFLVCVMLLMASTVAMGQFSNDPVTNYAMRRAAGIKSIGDYASDFANSIQSLAAQKAAIQLEVLTSREAYWKQYPNGPNLEEAGKRFATALQHKDAYYMINEIIGKSSPPLGTLVHQLSGGDIDGGIPRAAQNTFIIWNQELWKNIGAGGLKTFQLLLDSPRAKAEIAKANPQYLDYRVRRDWEEYRAHGVIPPNVDQQFWDNVLQAVEIQKNAGIGSLDRDMDIYSYAFDRSQRADAFSTGCSAYLAKIAPDARRTACSCIDQVFKQNLEPKDFVAIHDKFDEQRFLLSAVSKTGLHEKVAACIH